MSPPDQARAALLSLPILLVIGGYTLFANLGGNALRTDPLDESMHTGVAMEMARTGSLRPTYHGAFYAGKPPLKLIVSSWLYRFFGPSETVLRSPDAFLALLAGLMIWIAALRAFHPLTAILAPVALWTSPSFLLFHGAREAVQDTPITFCVTLALLGYFRAIEQGKGFWLPSAAMAAGVMVKSAVGLLPFFIMLPYLLLTQRAKLLRRRALWTSMAVPTAIYAAWDLAFNRREFVVNIIGRATSWKQHLHPPWIYLDWLYQGLGPWAIPVAIGFLGAAIAFFRERRGLDGKTLAWFLGILVPFSVAVSKLPWYIYPLYPAAALLAARALLPPELWRRPGLPLPKALSAMAAIGFSLLAIHGVAGPIAASTTSPPKLLLPVARDRGAVMLLYEIPLLDLCPSEEFYLAKEQLAPTPVADLKTALDELATHRAGSILLPAVNLQEIPLDLLPSLRVARFAGSCDVGDEAAGEKHGAPPRALVVLQGDDLPTAFVSKTPVEPTRGFHAPESYDGPGQMQWMGSNGSLQAAGHGTYRLRFRVMALNGPKTLTIAIEGNTILEEAVTGWREVETAPFRIEGRTTLLLATTPGCDIAREVLKGSSDGRCLSVAIAAMDLRETAHQTNAEGREHQRLQD